MKKTILALATLSLISGTALAERNFDLRESDTFFGKFSEQVEKRNYGSSDTQGFRATIDVEGTGLTAFERMMKNSAENESGHNNGDRDSGGKN